MWEIGMHNRGAKRHGKFDIGLAKSLESMKMFGKSECTIVARSAAEKNDVGLAELLKQEDVWEMGTHNRGAKRRGKFRC